MPFFCYNKNDYCDHSENCDNCNVWVLGKGGKKVPSNADRIRAMTDEELTQWFTPRGCPSQDSHSKCFERSCADCWKEWLQQPCEGE